MRKKILVEFYREGTGLGDFISMMPYVEKFRVHNDCELYFLARNNFLSSIYKDTFREINFITSKEGMYFDKVISLHHEKHEVPLQKIFALQLGFLDWKYLRPWIDVKPKERPIKNKYVTIGVHSTAQLKYWNHPSGKKSQPFSPNWNDLCGMIRKEGYTPVVVELNESFGIPPFRNGLPQKANKKIGLPVDDLINYIYHSEFFIGPSSGLIWIAHALGKKVAMISNFTEDWNEMDLSLPDYKRITNKSVCHGCWNRANIDFNFDNEDWYWCPRHKGTSRQFECHTSITPEMVFNEIKEWLV